MAVEEILSKIPERKPLKGDEIMFTIGREPTTSGDILDEEFLKPLNITQKQLSDHLSCDVKVINRIVNNRTSITAVMAFKLASALGTSPEFWLNAQQAVDIYNAKKKIKTIPEALIKV